MHYFIKHEEIKGTAKSTDYTWQLLYEDTDEYR